MSDIKPHLGSYKGLFPLFWKLSLTLWSERPLKVPGKYNTGAQGQPKAGSTGHTSQPASPPGLTRLKSSLQCHVRSGDSGY